MSSVGRTFGKARRFGAGHFGEHSSLLRKEDLSTFRRQYTGRAIRNLYQGVVKDGSCHRFDVDDSRISDDILS